MNQIIKSITFTLIFLVIIFLAACHPMRRESKAPVPVTGEIVLSLDQALNLSLAYGDYRQVNVDWAEVI